MAKTDGMTREQFLASVPEGIDGEALYSDIQAEFDGEERDVVAAQTVKTLTAGCTEDEFRTWDYDHLEFIIDMSNDHGFTIPRNFINGLPEQLILLIDADNLGPQGCPDDDD